MTTGTIKSTSLAALCATALSVGAAAANAQFAGFGTPTILSAGVGDLPTSVVIGDFDGDNDKDIAVTYTGTNRVAVFMNNGDGTFAQQPFTVGVGVLPGSIVTGDVDQDNDLDLATANAISADVSVLTNDGLGAFTNIGAFSTNATPQSMAIGDLNGDGMPDAIVVFRGDANHNGGVAVLLSQMQRGGGDANDTDLAKLLIVWGPEGGGTAWDYNKDGVVDVVDLATLLGI